MIRVRLGGERGRGGEVGRRGCKRWLGQGLGGWGLVGRFLGGVTVTFFPCRTNMGESVLEFLCSGADGMSRRGRGGGGEVRRRGGPKYGNESVGGFPFPFPFPFHISSHIIFILFSYATRACLAACRKHVSK